MSPEQARHERIDGRADIYSTGVMLFEVFTGDRLVIVNNDAEAHQVGPYVVPSGETLTQDYPDPGVISQGICTLHPDGRVEIVITERA